MDLQEFKRSNPTYKDVPDAQLADGIYNKYYAGKVDKPTFYKQISYNPQPETQAAPSKAGSVLERIVPDIMLKGTEAGIQGAAQLESSFAASLGLLSDQHKKALAAKQLYVPHGTNPLGEGAQAAKSYSQAVYAPFMAPLAPLIEAGTEAAARGAKSIGIPSGVVDKIGQYGSAAMDLLGVAGVPGKMKAPIEAAAIKTPEGIVTGKNHAEAYKVVGKEKDGSAPEGFVQNGGFISREEAAKRTGIPTTIEAGRLHSEDIAKYRGLPPEAGIPQPKIFTDNQPVASTKNIADPRGVSDRLFQHYQNFLVDEKELADFINKNARSVEPGMGNKFTDHLDDPTGHPLTLKEKAVFDKTILPMESEINRIRAKIKDSGFDVSPTDEPSIDVKGRAIRQVKGMGGPIDRVLRKTLPQTGQESGRRLSTSAGTMKGRTLRALETPEGRMVVYIDKQGNVTDATVKRPIGKYDPASDTVSIQGIDRKLGEATQKEIHEATGGKIDYHKDAVSVYATTLAEIRRAERSIDLLNDIKESPEFSDVARHRTSEEIPKGWKRVEGVPGFDTYYFEPRYAEELEDFVGNIKDAHNELSLLDKANRFMLATLFFANPIHTFNITEMGFATKGAAGLLKDPGFVGDFAKAAKDVIQRNKNYTDYARSGVSLPGLKDAGNEFHNLIIDSVKKDIGRDPMSFLALAKMLGNSPKQLIDRINNISHKLVWGYQDAWQLALIKNLERTKSMDRARATESVAQTFPTYRTYARVGGSRVLGKVSKSQMWLEFPKYAINKIQGMANILKKLKTPEERARGIDQLFAIGLMYYGIQNLVDPLLKRWTGNPDAESGSFGYGSILDMVHRLASNRATPGQVVQSTFSPGYVLQGIDMARGISPYFPKALSLPGETAGEMFTDYASDILNRLSPAQRFGQVAQGRLEPSDLLWNHLLGVRYPSSKTPRLVKEQLDMRRKYGTPLQSEMEAIKRLYEEQSK